MSFNPSMKGDIAPVNNNESALVKVSEILQGPIDKKSTRRLICAGVYIDENDQVKTFIPKITFSVVYGDDVLLDNTDTFGFVDLPVSKLPEEMNGPSGFNTDEKGKYIFYTSKEGKQVKIYHNGDQLFPENAKAYILKSGFLPDTGTGKFSAIQSPGTRSRNKELFSNLLPEEKLKELNS